MRTLKTLTPRPGHIPEGWEIHNAPRPLAGHETWQGDFMAGVFYAAVDPAAADYRVITQRNEDLDATRLVFVTEADVVAEMTEHYRANLPVILEKVDPDDPATRRKMVQSWFNLGKHRGDSSVNVS